MKNICAFDGILLLLVFYCCVSIPTYSSHPLDHDQINYDHDDDSNYTYFDYGLEPEGGDADRMDLHNEPSAQENDIAEFIVWATNEHKKSPLAPVQTWRPSQKDVVDISDQSIGSIQAHLKCQSPRGCNNCYVWANNGLYPAPCPTAGVAVAIQSIPSNTNLLLFLSISIFSFTNHF